MGAVLSGVSALTAALYDLNPPHPPSPVVFTVLRRLCHIMPPLSTRRRGIRPNTLKRGTRSPTSASTPKRSPFHDHLTNPVEDWSFFDEMLEEEEFDKTESYRNNLDNILVFVSLI